MRIYSSQYNMIARDIVKTLVAKQLVEIEPGNVPEAELDVVGVLREYNRMARQIAQQARDLAGDSGRSIEMKTRRRLARDKNFGLGDDGLEYVINQIIETFDQSTHIDEIFGSDRDLRAAMTPVVERYTRDRSDELDREVRSKIKNLSEGSAAWDIEYERVMERVKRTSGLEE